MNCRRQIVGRPAAQASQSPQGTTAGTITARPTHSAASSPAATTRPEISWPSTSGSGWRVGTPSTAKATSVWQTPQPATSTTTSCAAGSSRPSSHRSSG